jgi:nitrate reductase beta subunit
MLPLLARVRNGAYELGPVDDGELRPLLSSLERARVPLAYMASLFSAGNMEAVAAVYRKLIAVRIFMRSKRVNDVPAAEVEDALRAGRTTADEAEAIFRLTAMPTLEERFVVPPLGREMAIEATMDPFTHKREGGFGFRAAPGRGW